MVVYAHRANRNRRVSRAEIQEFLRYFETETLNSHMIYSPSCQFETKEQWRGEPSVDLVLQFCQR
jgi:hypothetical protein